MTKLLAGLLMSWLLCFAQVYAAPVEQRDAMCGPRCLAMVCEQFGSSPDVADLARAANTDPAAGTSLLGIQTAARQQGLFAVGAKIGLDELAGVKCPAIILDWAQHFLVLQADGKGGFNVTSPPGETIAVSAEKLSPIYSGFAILVSKTEEPQLGAQTSSPDLRVDKYKQDAGFVDEGDVVRFAIQCRNEGKAPLQISRIDASCDCVSALPQSATVAPGAATDISAAVDTTGEKGSLSYVLSINSNDPVTPVVKVLLSLAARSSTLVVMPKRIDFGRVKRQERVTKRL